MGMQIDTRNEANANPLAAPQFLACRMVYLEQPQMSLKDFVADSEKNGPPVAIATERGPDAAAAEPADLERKFWSNVSVSSPPL